MFNRGLREEFCTRVTHIYTISVCAVGGEKKNGSLKDKQAPSTLTATEMQVYVLLVALLSMRRFLFFFAKCNAKNSDTHNVSLHTVEECRG